MIREIEPESSRDRCGYCGGWKRHAEGSSCRERPRLQIVSDNPAPEHARWPGGIDDLPF